MGTEQMTFGELGYITTGDTLHEAEPEPVDLRIRQFLQIVSDMTGGSLSNLRVLDLACLTGYFSVEFAAHGSQVVGIEAREVSVKEARLSKESLSLNNVEFFVDDVRNLSKEKYGEFDVVLCPGILYHLYVPDVLNVVQRVAEVCRRFAIIDTIIDTGMYPARQVPYTWNGNTYWCTEWQEFSPSTSAEEKLKNTWASVDNEKAVFLTRPSLCNVLRDVGFTSVYECRHPLAAYVYSENRPRIRRDRITLLAIKGHREKVLLSPGMNAYPEWNLPEKGERGSQSEGQTTKARLASWIARILSLKNVSSRKP
ncbi:class I SAM-dependent methyltransferase [bacterium]|nr:MAG: class I SAM-dependent methyltransferase [bacterium]